MILLAPTEDGIPEEYKSRIKEDLANCDFQEYKYMNLEETMGIICQKYEEGTEKFTVKEFCNWTEMDVEKRTKREYLDFWEEKGRLEVDTSGREHIYEITLWETSEHQSATRDEPPSLGWFSQPPLQITTFVERQIKAAIAPIRKSISDKREEVSEHREEYVQFADEDERCSPDHEWEKKAWSGANRALPGLIIMFLLYEFSLTDPLIAYGLAIFISVCIGVWAAYHSMRIVQFVVVQFVWPWRGVK